MTDILFFGAFILLLVVGIVTLLRKKYASKTVLVMIILALCMAIGHSLGFLKKSNNREEGMDSEVQLISDKYTDILVDVLDKSYGDNYSIEHRGLYFDIRVWGDGLRNYVDNASAGNEEYISGWNGVVSGLNEICGQYYNMMSEQDAGTLILSWSIVDETDQDTFLCTSVNGTKVYDALDRSEAETPEAVG